MGTCHLPVIGMNSDGANRGGEFSHGIRKKQPVRTDSNEAEPGANISECLFERGVPVQRVPSVHHAHDGEVGIGIEALKKPVALMIEIACNIETAANEPTSPVI